LTFVKLSWWVFFTIAKTMHFNPSPSIPNCTLSPHANKHSQCFLNIKKKIALIDKINSYYLVCNLVIKILQLQKEASCKVEPWLQFVNTSSYQQNMLHWEKNLSNLDCASISQFFPIWICLYKFIILLQASSKINNFNSLLGNAS